LDENAKKKGPGGKGKSKAPPAVVLLLSDGKSTTGLPPGRAAQQAKALNVPVYTVALGTENAVVQVADPVGGFRTVQVPPDRKGRRELTAAFAAGGLALMMLGGAFSLFWFGRLP